MSFVRAVVIVGSFLSWLSVVHLGFSPDRSAVTDALAQRQRRLALEDASPERAALRRQNPEWDLMQRTFAALAFSNLALAEPSKRARHLEVVDALITQTLRDAQAGPHVFLLPYGRRAPFTNPSQRSLFVDGELALMLAARQVVERRPDFDGPLRAQVDVVAAQLEAAPGHLAESYPDEGWTFCNTIALATLRLSDRVDGRSHQALIDAWLASAERRLIDERTGLLRSSFRVGGAPLDGPEGSTLWLSAHMLQLVDPALARRQYDAAKTALGRDLLGFAWAAEWPAVASGPEDIDSGPTIPLLDANAGSSGLAVLGAAAFDDDDFLDGLLRSLELGAFPQRANGELTYLAGNALADAVVLAGVVEGPLWRRATEVLR